MSTFIEKSDTGFNLQLKNFVAKIGNYSTALGLSAGDLTAVRNDSAGLDYVVTNIEGVQTYSQTYTAFKNNLRKGGSQTLGTYPAALVFGTAPTLPAANVEGRFRALVQRIKHSAGYTEAIGQDLGIEAVASSFSPTNGKPKFFIEPSSGGHPNLRWTKGKFEGVEIWKDSGKGFVKLDRDMKPDYIDKSPLPEPGATAMWRYKMIYIFNDELVGSWSDEVSVTVFGEV